MPKQIPEQELATLIRILGKFPEGASLEDIRNDLEVVAPRRTLQRRLARLVEEKRLHMEGRGRGSRYRIPPREITAAPPAGILSITGHAPSVEIYIPVSAEGAAIKQAVRAPIQERRPVGYVREFLDQYRPNESFYLPIEARIRLNEIGRSPSGNHAAGTYARQIYHRLLIDLSWNSSRLEGNTYSLLETERLIDLGETAVGKDASEAQMILNHKAAIDLLVEQADEIGFNRYTILNLHALLSDNLLADQRACGRLRSIPVGIDGTSYLPLEVPQRIEEVFDQVLHTATLINDPFEQAFFGMVHLPYLQPFEDVNKRVSRLAANVPLIRDNLCPLSFIDVPNRAYIDGLLGVYELNRVELLRDVFCWAYERSSARYSAVRRSLGEPDPFRLKHRERIAESVQAIVIGKMDKQTTTSYLRERASAELSPDERDRFVEVVETEVMNLHEGNMARFRLRPTEYRSWKDTWH